MLKSTVMAMVRVVQAVEGNDRLKRGLCGIGIVGLLAALIMSVGGCRSTQSPEPTAGEPMETATARDLSVPAGFRAVPGTVAEPYASTGYAKEIVHEKTGIAMVFIPAGEFMMGAPDAEPERGDDETPQQTVKIAKPFYLGKYEVTQGQWVALMEANPSACQDDSSLPVEQLSWSDCVAFCTKAGDGLRLPTEAEWEYACRAGTTTPFYCGETLSTDQANCDGTVAYGSGAAGENREKTLPVGSFAANPWGLHDMAGNVYEWCQSLFKSYPYPSVDSPDDPAAEGLRVLRGGSWADPLDYCRSANRRRSDPTAKTASYGFRVAVSVEDYSSPLK